MQGRSKFTQYGGTSVAFRCREEELVERSI
jgi:hypothetical protein